MFVQPFAIFVPAAFIYSIPLFAKHYSPNYGHTPPAEKLRTSTIDVPSKLTLSISPPHNIRSNTKVIYEGGPELVVWLIYAQGPRGMFHYPIPSDDLGRILPCISISKLAHVQKSQIFERSFSIQTSVIFYEYFNFFEILFYRVYFVWF